MKSIKIIIFILCCIILPSCNSINSDNYDPASWGADDYPFAKETALKVIECLDNNDAETLKSLLSESVLGQTDIEDRIETVFDFYNGKSISYDDIQSDIRSANFNKDHYEYKTIRIVIKNILTDTDEIYNMILYYVLVDNENPSRVGLSKIMFKDSKGHFLLKLEEET